MHIYLFIFVSRDTDGDNDTGDFERVSQQIDTKKIDISTTCSPDTVAVSTVTEVRNQPTFMETVDTLHRQEEFENSEFYIEESLPSSLEWGRIGRQVQSPSGHHIIIAKTSVMA